MKEYATEAIIIGKEPLNELDSRIDFYTRHFGRLRAKAKSARKPTSKLAAHLEPLTLSRIRLVEKNGIGGLSAGGLLVADALTIDRFEKVRFSAETHGRALELLDFFRVNVFENEADFGLWQWLRTALATGEINYDSLSEKLGGELGFSKIKNFDL